MAQTSINIRIDEDLKKQAEQLFTELGLNMSTAINLFVRQSVRYGGIPFLVKVDVPNAETRKAMEEADRISYDSTVKGFSSISELFEELNRED